MSIGVPDERGVLMWDEIASINHIGWEQVYDIEVEGTHNFVGNDIFAHNTYINNDLIKISAVNLDVGDIVRPASGSQRFVIATPTDENKVAGVVTATPATSGEASTSIAFSGQAVVKVSAENGVIKVGDRLALSDTRSGVAVKATIAGMTIGVALEDSTTDKVLTLINAGYWVPSIDAVGGATASGSATVEVSSSGSPIDVLATLANAVMTRVQSLWASGNVIAEGIKKTYYSVARAFDWEFDLATMVSGWTSREITISPTTPADVMGIFTGNGVQAAGESKLDLAENGAYLATYGVDSARGEIYLSGSSDLIGGEAKVFFDFSFTSVISPDVPLKVFITPTTFIQGQLYVSDKTEYGFVVKGMNGALDGKFDWLVIARRKGYEGNDIASPVASGSASTLTSPTPTLIQTPTSTPTPTSNPTPTSTPDATLTAEPTPAPTAEPIPTTPTLDAIPTLEATPEPILTPTPDPIPTLTPEPTPASDPTPEATVLPTPELIAPSTTPTP